MEARRVGGITMYIRLRINEAGFEACCTVSIHENILDFPDGYETRVGERG